MRALLPLERLISLHSRDEKELSWLLIRERNPQEKQSVFSLAIACFFLSFFFSTLSWSWQLTCHLLSVSLIQSSIPNDHYYDDSITTAILSKSCKLCLLSNSLWRDTHHSSRSDNCNHYHKPPENELYQLYNAFTVILCKIQQQYFASKVLVFVNHFLHRKRVSMCVCFHVSHVVVWPWLLDMKWDYVSREFRVQTHEWSHSWGSADLEAKPDLEENPFFPRLKTTWIMRSIRQCLLLCLRDNGIEVISVLNQA